MSEHEGVGMSYEQAVAALEGQGSGEGEVSDEAQSMRNFQTPEQASEPTPPAETQPQGTPEATQEAPADDSFMGSDFNPDLLPDELKPGFKQLQAAFTQKTQALAEQRKQFEEFGDPDQVRQAIDLYQSLQNPEYLQAFHEQLGSVLQEMGLSPEEAAAVAQEATQPQTPELSGELQQLVANDPELSPLAQKLASLEQELAGFKSQAEQERIALEQERQVMAQTAEIEQMARAVSEAHPEYKDDDWQAIFDRAQAHDGNVWRAAELYQADKDRIIQDYLASKPVPHSVTPTSGAGTISEGEQEGPRTLEEADKAAQAWLAANNAEEFAG